MGCFNVKFAVHSYKTPLHWPRRLAIVHGFNEGPEVRAVILKADTHRISLAKTTAQVPTEDGDIKCSPNLTII